MAVTSTIHRKPPLATSSQATRAATVGRMGLARRVKEFAVHSFVLTLLCAISAALAALPTVYSLWR